MLICIKKVKNIIFQSFIPKLSIQYFENFDQIYYNNNDEQKSLDAFLLFFDR